MPRDDDSSGKEAPTGGSETGSKNQRQRQFAEVPLEFIINALTVGIRLSEARRWSTLYHEVGENIQTSSVNVTSDCDLTTILEWAIQINYFARGCSNESNLTPERHGHESEDSHEPGA